MTHMGGDMELIVLRELRDKLLAENEKLRDELGTEIEYRLDAVEVLTEGREHSDGGFDCYNPTAVAEDVIAELVALRALEQAVRQYCTVPRSAMACDPNAAKIIGRALDAWLPVDDALAKLDAVRGGK